MRRVEDGILQFYYKNSWVATSSRTEISKKTVKNLANSPRQGQRNPNKWQSKHLNH